VDTVKKVKVKYNGDVVVSVPTVSDKDVEPGEVIEVDPEAAYGLCGAGAAHSVDEDGNPVVTPAENPLWSLVVPRASAAAKATAKKPAKKAAKKPAVAVTASPIGEQTGEGQS
jgi:hypothetical protein